MAWAPLSGELAVTSVYDLAILKTPMAPFPTNSLVPFLRSEAQVPGIVWIRRGDAGSIGWSADGKLLAVGTTKTVRLADPLSGAQVREIELPEGRIIGRRQMRLPLVAWSPAVATLLATCDMANIVEIWDAPSGDLRLKLDGGPSSHAAMVWSRKGDRLALVTQEAVTIFDTASAARISQTSNPIDVTYADFTPDLDRAVLAGNDGTLALWPPLLQDGAASPPPSYARWITGDWLELFNRDGDVQIWDVAGRRRIGQFQAAVRGSQSVAGFGTSEVATAEADGRIRLRSFSFSSSRVTRTFTGSHPPIYAIDITGGRLAALDADSLRIWELYRGNPASPQNHAVSGTGMVWTSPQTVLVSGFDGSVKEFDVTAEKTVWKFSPPASNQRSASAPARLAPDGKSFLAAGALWRREGNGPWTGRLRRDAWVG